MSEIIVNEYNITNPNISANQRIAFLSDIHSDVDKLEKVKEVLENLKVSAILLGGDTFDSVRDKRNARVIQLLGEISKMAEIFVTIGNHDMVYFKRGFKKPREVLSLEEASELYNELSSIDNIHVPDLPGETATLTRWSLNDNIDISALSMPIGYYLNKEQTSDYDELKKILDTILIDTKKFNILMCHSPANIVKQGVIDNYLMELKVFNLLLHGHVHGGMLIKGLRGKSRRGIVGPYLNLFPNNAYGYITSDNTTSLTSGGITKFANSSEFSKLTNVELVKLTLDTVFPPELEVVNLMPGEENAFTKVKK